MDCRPDPAGGSDRNRSLQSRDASDGTELLRVMAQLGAVGLCMLWSSALGEEEGEIEQDDVTWTTALALIGFLVISTGVVYLVHCHDEDIRRASWDLVNTTISIFCASSFDFGLTRVLTTIILKIQTYLKGDKLDLIQVEEKREEVLHMWWVILIVAVLAMSFFSWLHRSLLTEENHRTLFAGGNLGGHVCAFAGIIVFGHIQKYNPCWEWLVAVAFLAFTLLVLLYGGVLSFAKRHCPEKWKQKQQIHVLKEMQGEASAIVIGFLLVQTICFVGSTDTREEKKFMPILAGHPVKSDWRLVVCLAVLALLLLGFSACWSIKCQKKCRKGTVCFSFFLEFVGKLASLTGCWCLQRGGLIGFYYICKVRKDYWNTRNTNKAQYARAIEQLPFNDPQATNRATLLNALVMSVVAVVLMVVMDIIADRLQGKPCCHDGDWEMMEMQDAERDASTSQVQRSDSTASAASGLFDLHADFPKVLRAAIAGFGFLVGICWDKAFETAYDMILTTKSATLASVGEEHKRKFRLSAILDDWVRKNPHFFSLLLGLVGILISVFVGRAWYRFIVQNAMKEEGQHIDEIEAEDRAYNLVKLPSDKMPSEVDDTSSSLDETESH